MSPSALRSAVEGLFAEAEPSRERALPILRELFQALEAGRARAALPAGDGWEVQRWVKRGILLAFKVGENRGEEHSSAFHFRDRDTTYPTLDPNRLPRDVRVVPGGTTIRCGAFLGDRVVIMPPAYVNVGAWVGDGSMVDSHVLVGSCAQIGRDVHLSAAVQIGGVLEPVGAAPVIVEDGAFIGGGCGIYEGTRIGAGAVLASGVVLTRGVPVHDLVRETVHRAGAEQPLSIPAGAVVVPGSRPAAGEYARELGIQLQTPIIVKYRDHSTDAALVLEEALR